MSETIFNNEDSGPQPVHFIRSFVSKLLPQKILLLLLIIFSSFSSYSIAGIQEKPDIPGMVQRSELIIRGKVISTESQWKQDSRGRHIYTSVTVKILDKIKGNIKDDAFVFEVVGGTVDDIREDVSDTPAFEVDEDAILFLAGDPLAIQHGINGKIPIYDSRVYLDGSEATTDSFIQALTILGQNPNATTSLEGKYPAPKEGIEAAQCYIYNGNKWFGASPTVCYYINENTFDCSGEGAAVQRGANTWNNVGADFTFQHCGSCSSTSEGMNGINCIMWGTTGGSLATAYRWTIPSTGEIVECDIVFHDGHTWSTDPDTPFGEYDVESVAVHELGHWLHLADLYDPADSDKVMYGSLGSGEEVRTLHSCDIDGICYIYGGCPSCSITVTSPTGNSNWETGTSHTIMWASSNNPGSFVKIQLYKGSSLIQTITSSTNDDGLYSWTPSISLADGSDYRIKITATLDSSCYDYSSYFAIYTPCSINITSPDGNCWEVGQVYDINWVSDNISGNVKIDLYKGGSLDRVITASTPDTGTYAWSVPVDGSLTGDCDYRIRMTDVLSSSCDGYSTYFCIATPPEAQDDNVTTSKSTPVMITLQTMDEGCPNPPAALTYIIISLPSHGDLNEPGVGLITDPCTQLVGYGNQVEYMPDIGYEGQDSFTFIAYDGGVPPGGGDSNEAIITIDVLSCTTIPIGTGTLTWSYPMHTSYHDSRTQVIYLASEIGIPGIIKDLALDVTTVPGQTMNNWTIRMKHTSLDNYSTPSLDATGWITVYDENESISSTGWRTFTFSTPFAYNGSDNLLVDFSHNNSSYSSYGLCMVSTTLGARSAYAYSHSGYGDPLTWLGTTSPSVSGGGLIPNVQLTICEECSLDVPVLHPEPDTTLDTCNTIYWDPIPDANLYYVQCANDANFYNIIANSGWIHDANYEFCSLELGQTYWYRVLAWTSFQRKDWLQTTQVDFETDTLTDTIATADGNVLLADAGTPTVDVMGDTTNSNSGIQRMRLVACECTSNRVLTEIEAYLNISLSTELRFVVYESNTQSGTYTKIHENTILSSGTGQRFYSSGPIAISLQAGKYYTMGSAWLGTAGYYSGVTPPTLAFGNVFGYAYQDSYPPPGTHGSPTSYSSYYYHRLTTTTQTGYVSSGTIVSTEINLPFDGNWEVVDFNTTTPADTDLTVDILPAAGSTPIPGYENVSNSANLSGISEPTIRLRANLSTINTNNTPVLHNWSVTYTDPTFACESGWSNVESSLQCNTLCDFDNSNTINFADYAILTGQWRQAPGSPSADIAPEVPDGFVDHLDLSVFVEDWLLELTCTVGN